MRQFLVLLTLCFSCFCSSAQVGNLDPTFGGTGIVQSATTGTSYRSMAVQTDGKVLAASKKELARFNPNGSPDAGFGVGGKQTIVAQIESEVSLALQPDGKIIVGGSVTSSFSSLDGSFILLRYTTSGKLDSTFGINGIRKTGFRTFFDVDASEDVLFPKGAVVAVQSNGKIVAAGWVTVSKFGVGEDLVVVARYNQDGSLDRTFGEDGRYAHSIPGGAWFDISAIIVQQDRKIAVAGTIDNDFAVARYTANGTLDLSFDVDGIQTTNFTSSIDSANAITLQPDGKILVAGKSNNNFGTARYHPSGSLDNSFDADGKKTNDFISNLDAVHSVAVQADGKIIVAGTNGGRFALARYKINGSLDSTFSEDGKQTTDVGTGTDKILDIVVWDNKLYVSGYTAYVENGSATTKGVVAKYDLGTVTPTSLTKAIKVNIYGGTNPYGHTEWNNWNVSSSLNSGNLKFSNASVSTISATLSKSSGINDNGVSYGGYMAPPEVLRYASNSTTSRTLTLSGLSAGKKYSIDLFASRGNTGNRTSFTVNGAVVSILSDHNKEDKASFINLVPSPAGQIVISISNINSYNYLNGFILLEQSGQCPGIETTPLYPLKGQLCTGSSVTLTASGGSSYQWFKGDGSLISGQTTATYTTTQAGIYTVRAMNGSCASGISEDAAVEGKIAYPSQPPEEIGISQPGVYCDGANIGINTTVGQTYTWTRNGTKVKGPVDGNGDAVSFSFTAAAEPFNATSAANAVAASGYSIPLTVYRVYTTRPGCTDTLVTQDFEVYHAAPPQGLSITALDSTSVSFEWQPLAPISGLIYYYSVTTDPVISNPEQETENTFVVEEFLTPGTTYYIHIAGACTNANKTGVTTLKFTTPSANTVTKTLNVNLFGGTNPFSNVEWNNWNVSASLNSGVLKYSDGELSSIAASLSRSNGVNDNGTTYGSGMAPAPVLRHTTNSTAPRTLTFSGLAASKFYSIEIYASRNSSSGQSTLFSINGASQSISTYQNLADKAIYSNLQADATGKLVVYLNNLQVYNYINGFILKESAVAPTNDPPTANAGADKATTLPANSVVLNGSGSDGDGSVYKFTWTKTSGPASFEISNRTSATTTLANLVAGTYVFRLSVTDDEGATAYDEVQVVVSPSSVTTKSIKVNLYGGSNPYNNPEWNNWNVTGSLNSGTLKYHDASLSTVSVAITRHTLADNGASYGGTMCPPEVLRYTSYSTATRTLTFSGLSATKSYALELYASRANTGNSTTFTVNGTAVTVLTDNNKTAPASFAALVPDAAGQLVVTLANVNNFNYLNGFLLTENAAPPPVTKAVKVNLYGGSNPFTNPEWNNWNVSGSLSSGALNYSDGAASNATASITKHILSDNGAAYGGTMAPPGVLRYASYGTTERTLTLSGLLPSKTYKLELYASRANTGHSTLFTIGGGGVTVLTDHNKTTAVSFNSLTPNASGQLVLSIKSVNTYNYLNGFILTEVSGAAAPITGTRVGGGTVEGLAVEATKGSFEQQVSKFEVSAYPNPSNSYFTIRTRSLGQGPVDIRLVDEVGRVVEQRQNVAANTTIIMGRHLRPGTYYLEGVEGQAKQRQKLIKITE